MLHKCLPLSPQTQAWDFHHPVVLMSALPSSCQCNEMFTPTVTTGKQSNNVFSGFRAILTAMCYLGRRTRAIVRPGSF